MITSACRQTTNMICRGPQSQYSDRSDLLTRLLVIPEDSRVEIDAKIHAGYFTTGKVMTMEELGSVQGRPWDDIEH